MSPSSILPFRRAALAIVLFALTHGCSAATAGGDIEQAGVAADVTLSPKLEAALSKITTKVENSRGIIASNINDVWTGRLLASACGLAALSYPVGKILWIVFGSAAKRCTRKHA